MGDVIDFEVLKLSKILNVPYRALLKELLYEGLTNSHKSLDEIFDELSAIKTVINYKNTTV